MERKYDLNQRLIYFASACVDITERLPKTLAGLHIASQMVRSSTSPALHYGEAQAAESSNDFIHKMKICLKELRETLNALQLIELKKWDDPKKLSSVLKECNELVSIFVTSVKTARNNSKQSRRE
jgi:four helix bundle protein